MSQQYPSRIRYEYEQDPETRLQYTHGVWGGINPQGEIEISFYLESDKMPPYSERIIAPDGSFGHEIAPYNDEERTITRHIHSRVVMNYHTARAMLEWLEDKVAALEAEADRHGREQQLEHPRPAGSLSRDGALDDVHARAVIVPRAEQHGEQHDGAAAEKDTQVAVRDGFAKRFAALPQRDAVDDAQHRARRRDSDDRSGAHPRKRHGRAERERLRRRAERAGKICCRERRGKAR
mgnify:CR=1 FL=1